MKSFIVVRHGSNGANQPMTNRAVLGTISAETRSDAVWSAHNTWTFYSNQHIELIGLSGRAKRSDREAAAEMDAIRSQNQ